MSGTNTITNGLLYRVKLYRALQDEAKNENKRFEIPWFALVDRGTITWDGNARMEFYTTGELIAYSIATIYALEPNDYSLFQEITPNFSSIDISRGTAVPIKEKDALDHFAKRIKFGVLASDISDAMNRYIASDIREFILSEATLDSTHRLTMSGGTGATAYQLLTMADFLDADALLDIKKVPRPGRFILVDNVTKKLVKSMDEFVHYDYSDTKRLVNNSLEGSLYGYRVYYSANSILLDSNGNITGTRNKNAVVFAHPTCCQYVVDPKIEYRNGESFTKMTDYSIHTRQYEIANLFPQRAVSIRQG